jgi:hypothetical protein
VPANRVAHPQPQALELVTPDLARRHMAFPMWIEKRKLHVAMLDPVNANRVDELAFATGLSVVPYVAAERRLVSLLERHYDIRPDSRFTDTRILELAGHVRPARRRRAADRRGAGRAATATSEEEEERARWRESHGIAPLAEGEELSVADEFEALSTTGAEEPASAAEPCPADDPCALEPASSAQEAARLGRELVLLADREAVVPIALRIAAYHAYSAAVFSVRDGMVQGVQACGASASQRIDGVYVPVEAESMFSGPARGSVFHGRPSRVGADAAVARALGADAVEVAAVLPVTVNGQVVQLLYVDDGRRALRPESLAALGALCDSIAAAYGRLISEQTRRHC